MLFGYLDSEVGALRQRKAEYDEARRLSDGSDSCWSGSGSEAILEACIEPLALEGAVVVVAQGGGEEEGDRMKDGQGALQPGGRASAVMRKRAEREEQGGGIKRRGHQSGAGQAGVKRRRQRQRKSAHGQADGKWYLKGFSTNPGGTKPVAGKYTVGTVESQV